MSEQEQRWAAECECSCVRGCVAPEPKRYPRAAEVLREQARACQAEAEERTLYSRIKVLSAEQRQLHLELAEESRDLATELEAAAALLDGEPE